MITKTCLISRIDKLSCDQISGLIMQKKLHVNLSDRITPYDNDEEWKNRLTEMWWAVNYKGDAQKEDPRYGTVLPLRDLLLAIGGCEVCLPVVEGDLEDIMKHGQLWDNCTVIISKGKQSQCHSNSALFWSQNKRSFKEGCATILCTGYALSKDGFWRQHSWVMRTTPRSSMIIETTEPRIAYYGFGMNYEQAEKFKNFNL